MGRVVGTFFFGLLTALVLAAPARAQEVPSFNDPFDAFDTERWSAGDHNLGRSYLDPANVSVANGALRLAHPARTYEGAEVLTNGLTGYGSYAARIRAANAPGSITGFFLYKSPDFESEIDIEILNDPSGRVMFTTYAGGRQTHSETVNVGFDPTAAFHTYAFDYSQNAVTFTVDGRPMRTWNTGIPQTSMHLMINSWYPTWLEGRRLRKNAYTLVDSVRYDAATP